MRRAAPRRPTTPLGFRTLAVAVVAVVLLAGCAGTLDEPPEATDRQSGATEVDHDATFVVHRTATCGCCGTYEDHLADHGFDIRPEVHDDLSAVRQRLGVPDDQASCHTGEVAGYAVEGHVPLAAIERLLAERPDVDGIALAGMPAGSPGMPGEQEAPFVVTLVDDGEVVGELGRF